MKCLIVEISFFEAFFKVHFTKTSKLTYPIPLPTTVAGIFGSFLGFSRGEAYRNFKDCFFGACLINGKSYMEFSESMSYVLHKKRIRGVERVHIVNNPSYYIVIAGNDEKIKEFENRIKNSIAFLPFGGQNDFFVRDWKIKGIKNLEGNEAIVSNYVPTNYVEEILPGTVLKILPVMHKFDADENFTFVIDGNIKVKEEFLNKIKICKVNDKNIALYSLNDFYMVGEWK